MSGYELPSEELDYEYASQSDEEEMPFCGPNSKISMKKWSMEEDNKLLDLAVQAQGKKWKWVASQIPGKKDTQCRSRWERIRPGMRQGRWTTEEDRILMHYYMVHKDKWSEIAKYLENRTGKQVRDRIKNVFDARISRDEFTPEQDEFVYKVFVHVGPKWKHIRDVYFPDRTADFIKNRFYSHYKKLNDKFKDNIEEIKNLNLEEEKIKFLKVKSARDQSDSETWSSSKLVFQVSSPSASSSSPKRDEFGLNLSNNFNFCNGMFNLMNIFFS
jgi:hypothetical protein